MFESDYRYRPPLYLRRWFHVVVLAMFALGMAGVIFVSVKLAPYQARAQEFDFAEINKLEKASIIYDRKGLELGRIFVLNRDPVPIEKIPHHMIDAVVAAEDARFFKHDGVDRIGMARAMIRNVKAGSFKQGASTITQQLARNSFGMRERTYERKLVEAFLAMRIEKYFSKSEIMGMYLNRIYFGSGFYGVNAAAKGYFGKEVSEIDIGEAAVLAGLIKSPNKYSPLNNPELSKRERNYVFHRMATESMITEKEAKELSGRPLFTAKSTDEKKRSFDYPYQQVRIQVRDLLGSEQSNTGGFHIYTTIDTELQLVAQQGLVAQLAEIEKKPEFKGQTYAEYEQILNEWMQRDRSAEEDSPDEEEEKAPAPRYLQGATIVLENRTGAILAVVGGRDFDHSQFDRAMMSRRKAGTVFTPFVYAAGLRLGKLPGEKVNDAPLDNRYVQIGGMGGILGEWGVEGEFQGEGFIPARMALVTGKNAATVRYGMDVGVDQVVQFARDAGMTFEGDLQNYNSTFLGHSEALISEVALAYTTFPNLGRRPSKPFLIQTIRDHEGKLIFKEESRGPEVEVLNPYAAFQMHNALTDVMRIGAGKKAMEYGLGDFPVAGKTGTASEFKDLWFAGYTDQVTCVVWAGFDRSSTIYPAAFSSDTVLPLWTEIMNATQQEYAAKPIPAPPMAQSFEICTISGDRATEHCYHHEHGQGGEEKEVRDSYIEFFDPGVRFARVCAVHGAGGVVNRALLRPIGATVVRASPVGGVRNNIGYGSAAQPVLLHEPTVVGEDPYHSIPLRIRLKKPDAKGAVPGEAGGEEAPVTPPGPPQEVERNAALEEVPFVEREEEAAPAGIFIRPPGSPEPGDGGSPSNVMRAVPLGAGMEVGMQPALPRPHEERGPPARTEDGLPSILEEQPRFRLRPPNAQRIPFD